MKPDAKPPSFAQLFAREIERSSARRGWRAFFPWWLIVCLLVPAALCYILGGVFRYNIPTADAVAILAGIAVVSSFMGSTSIALTAHLQKLVSEYPFCNYLKDEGLFDSFLFWPQFVLFIQIASIFIAIFSAVVVGLFGTEYFTTVLILYSSSMTIYSFEKTWKLVDLIRQATWYFELYQRLLHEAETQ